MDIQLQNQLKRLVEVTALVGLSLHAHREAKVVNELEKYAFPNELAEKINKEIKEENDVSYVFDEELWSVNDAKLIRLSLKEWLTDTVDIVKEH